MPTRRDYANAIRALAMDAVQKANSGHPGMPMGMADIAEVLWNDFLRHHPSQPDWPNRDRFIISNGHGCMLQYSLLHLSGYALSIEDLKQFRQLHSKTPGHPEYGFTPGVETTTGPLGQGFANAVGMALAEKTLAAHFNRPQFPVVDHHTYVFLGDGCLMEGISHEAASLAGTLGLGKLIALYDDNGISIDGEVHGWFTDNTPKRFEAYNWHVIADVDGHDSAAIAKAIEQAKNVTDKPTLICCKTIIGFGSPNLAGSEKTHGAPLGDAEIQAAREELNWPHAPFVIPAEIKQGWDATEKGEQAVREWNDLFANYRKAFPELAAEFARRLHGELPEQFAEACKSYIAKTQQAGGNVATRKASLLFLNELGKVMPELLGGSADLTGSNLTLHTTSKPITPEDADGNYVFYGVREFGMAAIMNGVALHKGWIPYGGTFLVFLDYARNAVRLSALMKQRVVYVFTHDSIGLGEDGPTHQPIEHATMLRITPNMSVWRPCDAVETAIAWQQSLQRQDGPTALLLSRQNLEHQIRDDATLANVQRGGYILKDSANPTVILIATGSEVEIAVAAFEAFQLQGIAARVVSMPSTDHFNQQDKSYRDTVLPPQLTCRIAIEAGATAYWYQYVGSEGAVIGIDRFGESAPAPDIYTALKIDAAHILQTYQNLARSFS